MTADAKSKQRSKAAANNPISLHMEERNKKLQAGVMGKQIYVKIAFATSAGDKDRRRRGKRAKNRKTAPSEPKISRLFVSRSSHGDFTRLPSLAPRLWRPINLTAFMDFSRHCALINLVRPIKTDFELLLQKVLACLRGFLLWHWMWCCRAGNDLKLAGNGARPKTRRKRDFVRELFISPRRLINYRTREERL